MTKDNMPERILTRHYANGIINARDAKDGWSFSAGNEIANGEYVPASTLTHLEEENARQAAEIAALKSIAGDLLRYVPSDVVECRGDKCREGWCVSCFGDEYAAEQLEEAQGAASRAAAALSASEGEG